MSRIFAAFLVLWAGLVPAHAQSIPNTPRPDITVTIAIFATSASDPNVDAPVSTWQYPKADCGGYAFVEESTPITNPTVAYFPAQGPAGPLTYECRIDISGQIARLTNGTYKASYRQGTGSYSSFSSNFTKS